MPSFEGSCCSMFGRNKSYCRVLVAFSGQLLAVTNCTATSRWHFSGPGLDVTIVLPSLGGSSWPAFGRIKLHCRFLVGFFWFTFGCNRPYYWYDLLRSNMREKKLPRRGSTICPQYGPQIATETRQCDLRFVTSKTRAERSTGQEWPETATETRQYDLIRPRVSQKEPPRLGSTVCYGQTSARKSHTEFLRPRVGQKEPPRLCSTIYYGQDLARKSHETRKYDLLRSNVGQKEPSRLGITTYYSLT